MCGRFTLATGPEVVADFFGLEGPPPIEPRYNIAPTQPAPVVVAVGGESTRRFDSYRWGLIPSWAKDPSIGNRMINARAETVSEKPAYRSAFRQRRCLMLSDGFYEWQKGPSRKQPYHIRMKDGSPFAFAALWEHWRNSQGESIHSCALLTTSPNAVLQPIHNRMPVILGPQDYAVWLDPGMNQTERLTPLLVPYSPKGMTAYPVSTRVNRPTRDDPLCMERAEA